MKLTYLSLQATSEGQAAHAHVHEIVQGLRRLGWHVRLCGVDYDKDPSLFRRLFECLTVQVRAVRTLWGAEAVYVRWHFLSLPFVLAARTLRKPVVVEVNGTFDDAVVQWPALDRVRQLINFAGIWQLRLARHVIVVTPALATWVAQLAPAVPISVVSNGAATDLFRPDREYSTHLPPGLEYVVFFGALSRWQGLRTMLAAAEQPGWPEGVSLVLVGDGAERERVESVDARLGHVRYLGPLPYQAVASVVAHSRASLICKEGAFEAGGLLPLKLYESLACGVPVIVTDYPGISDVVRDNSFGAVIPPYDAAGLAEAVQDVLMLDESVGERARAWIEDGHSWAARAKETATVLRAVMGRAAGHKV